MWGGDQFLLHWRDFLRWSFSVGASWAKIVKDSISPSVESKAIA